jgi:hypothetical protein
MGDNIKTPIKSIIVAGRFTPTPQPMTNGAKG